MSVPRVSVVIPAYNEGQAITLCLDRILEAVTIPCEVLVVYDRPDDSTAAPAAAYSARDRRVRPVLNDIRPGPAAAIACGIRAALAQVVVVTMADGSDDPRQIEALTQLVEGGAVVAAASRYMPGGRQVGGPRLKGLISRTAGLSLEALARVGTHDPTNSFKAYSSSFLAEAGIESDAGFEIGIEMVAKARRRGERVAEIPTIWMDRTEGQSNFKATEWIPRYLHWYLVALLPGYGQRRPYKR
ncbi:MAG: glycosyltransferase [Candidatus Dormibacteria bacterium]